MRKQYDFRQSPRGLLARDIHRLVGLPRDLAREAVPISDIRELDEAYWSNIGPRVTCRGVVEHARLMQDTDLEFP